MGAGKEKAPVVEEIMPQYPAEENWRLVLKPSLSRLKIVFPGNQGVQSTKAWIRKVQQHAIKGPHLKIGLLYYEYLLRLQRDYEDMIARYNAIRKQEFLKAPVVSRPVQYQIELLAEQADELMAQWPKYNMHVQAKCELPQH